MNIQKIGDRTAELLNLYYNNEIEPFLNSCHEDVLWIGPADKHNIINLRKKWKGICSQVPFIVLKYRQGCI